MDGGSERPRAPRKEATARAIALFRRFERVAERIPWTPLGELPTPVERLPIDDRPGSEAAGEIWVKRDDLTGRVYGGNKVRKLEFLLGAAVDAGARRLVTGGAIGSHHALATTIYGRLLGLDSTLVLFPQPVTPHVRDVLRLHHAFGAELRFSPRMVRLPLDLRRARKVHRGAPAALIAPGGSDEIGALGYVDAALELAEQVERGEAPPPDTVYAAAGTLGTVVGLAIGFGLAGLATRVVGVRVTSRLVVNRLAVRSLARRTLGRLARAGAPAHSLADVTSRIELRHGRIGRGYGHPTEDGRRARERLERVGLRLDPTYTAKVAAELFAAADSDRGPEGVRLFWHTLSAALPTERAASVGPHDLPRPFRRFLAE
ncbi:MAG: 1-aminocyclopropane-1-carboxylate deaminase/D-cysteine desulfhydrase [Gemmatimonadota bacterium]